MRIFIEQKLPSFTIKICKGLKDAQNLVKMLPQALDKKKYTNL